MKNADFFKNKKIIIVGMARSGLSCARLLADLGAKVFVTDNSDSAQLRPVADDLMRLGVEVELGRHTPEFISGADLLVISPGVTDDSLPVRLALSSKIPVISEIEIASMLCPAPIIAVTGACGKTTVTTLIGEVIKASGKHVFVCGNIGNPFCGEVAKVKEGDFISLEVSSFQLEKVDTFKPKISVILNFSANHLDRYSSLDDYLMAKKRIFMNQDEKDYLVLNADDPVVRKLEHETKARVIKFYESAAFNSNQAAVIAVARILGIEQSVCSEVFRGFRGLEHRFESVAEVNNIKFINDSKATTVESAISAIRNISGKIILIAGGKDKGVAYGDILPFAQGKVKEVILIGQAAEKIKNALGSALKISHAATLRDAVKQAYLAAEGGDYVLLSPMCSSFDMFSNYEERGKVFKNLVYELVKEGAPQR